MKSKIGLGAKRITALLLSLALLFLVGAPHARADELSDLRAEYDRLTQKIAESEKRLNDISVDKNKQQGIITELNGQIDDINKQMNILTSSINLLQTDIGKLKGTIAQHQSDITALNNKITNTVDEIEVKQTELENTKQEALERLRASYVAGNPSKLDILLSSDDLSVFFFNIELLKQIDKQENELMKKLKTEADALAVTKANLEKDKSALEQTKKALDTRLDDLESKKAQKDADAQKYRSIQNNIGSKYELAKKQVEKLDKNSVAYKAQLARYEREQIETDKRIDILIAQQASSSGDVVADENDGTMTWPVPYSRCYITAYFPFYPSGGPHTGIDIIVRDSGGGNISYGKKIVAAQGGKVLTSGWNGAYGKCVIIDHGGGLLTLYGHCSALSVSAGQTVNKGQKIAEIGSTGNSTGPHLHFGVKTNSNGTQKWVQPLNYVSKP
ncbi:MAG TPA: peptidoglycan DD-metalloendopeptidase family protein [Clostridia bacterium]|nr:peptidoglycan DD-metalloendopeptidase family protein [Clostridia bacterium]